MRLIALLLGKQGVPRWASTDAQIQAAYNQLVQKVCPCVIIVHSQGGNFAFNAALAAPDKVKALIAIEPSGAPKPEAAGGGKVKAVPHLVVWGDYIAQSQLWMRFVPAPPRAMRPRCARRVAWPTGGSCRRWASRATATC